MSIYNKLNLARIQLQNTKLEKSGHNKFAGYKYFELGDFLPTINNIFNQLGICGVVSFTHEIATLTITNIEDSASIIITSPMGSAALKGCHEVQNIGAVETYQRRYLWVSAMEIVENDIVDALTNDGNTASRPTIKQSAALKLLPPAFNLMTAKNDLVDCKTENSLKIAFAHHYLLANVEQKLELKVHYDNLKSELTQEN